MTEAIDLHYPFTGRWRAQNSPANKVPSHGTPMFATSYAIDLVHVTERGWTAPIGVTSLVRPEPAARFPGFGRDILAPVDGVVVAVHDGVPDHPAYRGFPSIRYALRQRQRAAGGWEALAGNHVMIEAGSTTVVLCHLQHGSVAVVAGQHVAVGTAIGRCGNSGNSTEPHVHIQAIDTPDVQRANAVPLTFRGRLPRNGEIIDA